MKQTFKKHYDKNSIVFNHSCLYTCRINDVKTKNSSRSPIKIKTPLPKIENTRNTAPAGLFAHFHVPYASILLYFRNQKNKRAIRRMAIANFYDTQIYAQA